MAKQFEPITGRIAWYGCDLARTTDWIREFSDAEIAEITAAIERIKARGLDLVYATPEDFLLPQFSAELARISDHLENGRGMILLRGLPLSYLAQDLRIAYWGLGLHLGVAVAQSPDGDFLGEVRDYGEKPELTKSRGSRTTRALPFHGDRCDVVGLLCVRPGKSGGASRVVSAATIHNEILARRPDLLDEFYGDFYQSRQGDEPPGEQPFFPQPIFGFRDGHFTGQFSPAYIEFAQLIPGCPPLTSRQKEAMALFRALADELCLDMNFRPGDIQLLNNHTIYHGRGQFEDDDEPERKRLLLRLWLSVPNSRPLPEGYEISWGRTGAGEIRGGIIPRTGAARDAVTERELRARQSATA